MRSKIFDLRSLLLILAAVLLAMGTACQKAELPEYRAYANDADVPRIPVQEAKKDYDAGVAFIIDSRDANAYNQEHIKGAINIPSGAADTDYSQVPRDKKIIVYCS